MSIPLLQMGMRYLDEVKHCRDRMTPEMAQHDRQMRESIPSEWTEDDVRQAREAAHAVNRRKP